MNKITVYTDGSALNNGSPDSGCGWACKLIYKGHEKMKSGGDKGKSNNVMEMTAVLEAMKAITDKSIPVEVFSDSKYVVETMNGYYKVKKNVDLWKELLAEKENQVWLSEDDVERKHCKCKMTFDMIGTYRCSCLERKEVKIGQQKRNHRNAVTGSRKAHKSAQ